MKTQRRERRDVDGGLLSGHDLSQYSRGHRRAGHPDVAWVRFPIFDDNPWTELAGKYLPEGPGAVFTFGVEGGFDAAAKFIAGVELASHLANVGDAKTLVIHPASTTHQQVPVEERRAAEVGDEMIRISVGMEDVDDIIWDLGQALERARR